MLNMAKKFICKISWQQSGWHEKIIDRCLVDKYVLSIVRFTFPFYLAKHNMLIIISNALPVPQEAVLINALFAEGLEIFHLRKPACAVEEMVSLIQNIKAKYRHKIALHQHHQIAAEWGIHRLHFTMEKRGRTTESELMALKEKDCILSTSIHKLEEYIQLSACFDYTFFGPVFNSISKQGYASVISQDFKMPVHENMPKVMAIGGIAANNIRVAMDKQFDGVAALGSIWQQPTQSLEQFKILQKAWKQTGR